MLVLEEGASLNIQLYKGTSVLLRCSPPRKAYQVSSNTYLCRCASVSLKCLHSRRAHRASSDTYLCRGASSAIEMLNLITCFVYIDIINAYLSVSIRFFKKYNISDPLGLLYIKNKSST